ncbi:TPA: hypothetical protein QDZ95_003028 [Shewanella algae]|uniref:hypothetical protein n=1 Tax=Shewanella algae TaxID=38313 RepID=UPI001C586267|nr:hypothetical protein [Shewanella algae]HDS1199504.1 hypothetical protein [Shewanella algae]
MNWISSACSFVSNALSGMGAALSSFAKNMAPVINTICNELPKVFQAVSQFANALFMAMGIIKPHENVEVLGERALQAAEQGITMDKYEDFDDYIDALRNFELDPDKAEKRSSAEKLTAGIGLGTVLLENKLNLGSGSLNGIWLLPMTNPDYFTAENVGALLSEVKFNGDLSTYFERRLSAGDTSRLESALANSKSVTNKDELFDALDKARDSWSELKSQLANTR